MWCTLDFREGFRRRACVIDNASFPRHFVADSVPPAVLWATPTAMRLGHIRGRPLVELRERRWCTPSNRRQPSLKESRKPFGDGAQRGGVYVRKFEVRNVKCEIRNEGTGGECGCEKRGGSRGARPTRASMLSSDNRVSAADSRPLQGGKQQAEAWFFGVTTRLQMQRTGNQGRGNVRRGGIDGGGAHRC